ncbi:prepilin peptidase [Vibrio breoganii]|nr:A24 family peptidase [Vibrio breoganii]PMI17897.1 hypothetical protein BCU49_13050 [Vibrio breoganii]
MNIFCWCVFFYIALSDLKKHRIPNKALIIILIMQTVSCFFVYNNISWLGPSLSTATVLFLFGLFFFFLQAMSPGDVKLLFVIGYVTGGVDILELVYWLTIGSGCVAILFFLEEMSRSSTKLGTLESIKNIYYRVMTRKIYRKDDEKIVGHQRYGHKLVMPFAPSLVIGLAMFYYFN